MREQTFQRRGARDVPSGPSLPGATDETGTTISPIQMGRRAVPAGPHRRERRGSGGLIDANVFMYAAGAEHPHKAPRLALLRRIALGEIDAAVDAEVLQEILHRYRAIRRWEERREVYALARRIVPLVVAITDQIVDQARDLLDGDPRLTARDALHAAVLLDRGMEGVCSYDRDLDRCAGLRRVEPQAP